MGLPMLCNSQVGIWFGHGRPWPSMTALGQPWVITHAHGRSRQCNGHVSRFRNWLAMGRTNRKKLEPAIRIN